MQIFGHLLYQFSEDFGELGAVAFGVQVALEGGFAAHGHGFAVRHHGAVIHTVGGVVQPGAVSAAKLVDQPGALLLRQRANGADAQARQLGGTLGPDAIDAARRQWPDACVDVCLGDDGQAVGLVQFAGEFGQQFVGRNANAATQTSGTFDVVSNVLRHRAHAAMRVVAHSFLRAGHIGQINVYLVNAAVFNHASHFGHGGFE